MADPDGRIVHLAAYGGSYPGSFIPMLESARAAVESHHWSFEAAFPPGAEHTGWYAALRQDGVRTHVAPARGIRPQTAWVRNLLSTQSIPTILHTHFSSWDIPAAFAARGHARTGTVWHLHSPLSDEPAIRVKNLVRFGGVGRCVDRILCVGPEIREKAVARWAPAERTIIFANGIDVTHFQPMQARDRAAARAQLGLPEGTPALLIFAWDWERKGGSLLLEAVRELRHRGREVIAVVVGSEREARDEALRLGVDTAVRSLAPVDDTRVLYAAADVFIAASSAEGLPFAMLEALCCDTPVIASDIASHQYPGRSLPGCRLVPRLAGAFSDAIEAELDSAPEDRHHRLEQSRARIERDHSLMSWSNALIDLYAQVFAAHR